MTGKKHPPALPRYFMNQFNETQPYRISFGSCHHTDVDGVEPEKVWDSVVERSPRAWLWVGDAIYADESSGGLEFWWKLLTGRAGNDFKYISDQSSVNKYNAVHRIDSYSDLISLVGEDNVDGVWDDHDFGLNNAGKEFFNKDITQQLYLDFLGLDENNTRRNQQGLFHSKNFIDVGVKVIFLDLRYFRDDYSNSDGDFLGEEQWAWLENELEAGFLVNIIVSSLQALPDDKTLVEENWQALPLSRDRLLTTVSQSSAQNVAFISGDIHYTELMEAECFCADAQSYILPELTSSGMTHSVSDSIISESAIRLIDTFFPSTWYLDGSKYLEKNFGEIDLDVSSEEGSLVFRSFRVDGDIIFERGYSFRDLKPNLQLEECQCEAVKSRSRSAGTTFLLVVLIFLLFKLIRKIRFRNA